MPVPELISFMTAAKWIEDLAKKYAKVKGERDEEITALANVFGDPVDLARFYVHPNCSVESPAEREDDGDRAQLEQPLFEVLEDFFARRIYKRDGRLFIRTILVYRRAPMRIATWNVNGLKARLEFFSHWLREVQPDVVGLQELKMTDQQFPHDHIAQIGYQAVTHGQKSWNGVAVLARTPIEVTQRGLPGQDDLGARLLSVQVAGLAFTTVYCPNGKSVDHPDYQGKLAWFDSLLGYMQEQQDPGRSTVLCGDFNIVPAPLDSWNEAGFHGTCHHTEAERTRIARLRDWGLTDLYRHLHPDEPGFSWWDYRAGAFAKRQGLRIDFLLASQSVVERVESVSVERRWRKRYQGLISSDHTPVCADLRGE